MIALATSRGSEQTSGYITLSEMAMAVVEAVRAREWEA